MEYKQLFSSPLAAAGFSTANKQSDVIAKKANVILPYINKTLIPNHGT